MNYFKYDSDNHSYSDNMAYIKSLIITFVLIMLQTAISSGATMNYTIDKFGIMKLYETAPGGREWNSNWDNGHARTWTDQANDPDDPQFWTKWKGSGTWKTDGKGILNISGSTPRMYVIDSNQTGKWRNVEITLYGKRISDNSTPSGGLVAVTRTNHMIDTNLCDTRGLGARIRYDGHFDFEKETSHPKSVGTQNKVMWPNGMPKNIWIGYKLVVYDLANGSVKLELWYDNTDGANGGNWTKINELIDDGQNFGVGGTPCKTGINPAMQLNLTESRFGSESGKPNLAVYFRSDNVNKNGLLYKKASIREIVPIPIPARAQNLIGYWKFDENRGINASDYSGNVNNGRINGSVWTTGKVGSALIFNGSNNYVDVTNSANFNLAKTLTIEAWIKPASTSGSYGIVGKKEWSSTLTGYHFIIHGNKLDFDAGNGKNHTVATSGALSWTTGSWYHVAATFENGTVNFYRNGVNIASSKTVSQIANNPQDFYIGSTKSITYPFKGAIDEVKIYNRALSALEVQGDYNAPP